MKTFVYNAAGGNSTAINFGGGYNRDDYAKINNLQQKKYFEVEQVGFCETQNGLPKLQMTGGEFCGNATRSFACLLKDLSPSKSGFCFYVSGYPHVVCARVIKNDDNHYVCEVSFSNFNYSIQEKKFDGHNLRVVDLGGIVHIIVDETVIPFNEKHYEKQMKEIKDALQVDCDAVGVIWVKREGNHVSIKPVVWVKEIDTCYYETSCGSGSIAVGLIEKKNTDITQPSGGVIAVKMEDNTLILTSEMVKIMQFQTRRIV